MAYTKNNECSLYEKDCKSLIKLLTQFNEEEENFSLCQDFMLSNLLCHSYLDVNSHKVKRTISGLHEKYLIHSDLDKAKIFKSVSQKLFDIFDGMYGCKKEQGYSILALLLYLSESDYTQPFHPAVQSTHSIADINENENIDWAAYLKDDDDDGKYSDFSDSSSEIFTSEEEDSVEDIEHNLLPLPPRDDSGIGISPDSCSGGSQQPFHMHNVCFSVSQEGTLSSSLDQKKPISFYPYWIPKYQQVSTNNPYNLISVNFTKIWEEHIISQNPLAVIDRKAVIHERNVIREILWLLRGVKELYLFYWNGIKFTVNSTAHLCNLTAYTLSNVLSEFCEYGTKRAVIQSVIDDVLLGHSSLPVNCLTYQSYAAAMQNQLQIIDNSIYEIERTLKAKRETLTLMILHEKVRSIFNDFDVLYQIEQNVSANLYDVSDAFHKACKLLNVLWKQLRGGLKERNSSALNIVLKVFLETSYPLFSNLENIIIHGTFEDPYGEFIFIRKVEICVTDEEFWEHGHVLRSFHPDIEKDFFLKLFLQDILVAGKSLEILNKIYALEKKEPFRLHVEKGELYSKFIEILQKLVSRTSNKKTELNVCTVVKPEREGVMKDPLHEQKIFSFQKTTAKFFCPDINPVYVPIVRKCPEEIFTEKQVKTQKIIQTLEPQTLKPLNMMIVRALETCMQYACYPTCGRLMKALKEKYNLMAHLNIMKKYFLMEAGDLMFSFYSKVFEKVFYNEPWQDVSFLYSVLQNAISEDKENCEHLYVFYDLQIPEKQVMQPLNYLNALQLSYEIEWPVSIMLGTNIQSQYCQIFSYLLQIKCAKYLLDELYFIGLYEREPPNMLMKLVSRSEYLKKQKIHGMYIIRMRLMFFVNGLHNYIMTRILHSFGLEFSAKLENSKTVDEMIVAHNIYLKSLHERCLLDRRLLPLKEKIFQVLNLCYSFKQLWLKGIDHVSLEDLQNIEIQFSNYSNFLLSYFNTPLRRGVYFHLESLVNTMLSDTHELHVFKQKKR